jgi:hypothetical protein
MLLIILNINVVNVNVFKIQKIEYLKIGIKLEKIFSRLAVSEIN